MIKKRPERENSQILYLFKKVMADGRTLSTYGVKFGVWLKESETFPQILIPRVLIAEPIYTGDDHLVSHYDVYHWQTGTRLVANALPEYIDPHWANNIRRDVYQYLTYNTALDAIVANKPRLTPWLRRYETHKAWIGKIVDGYDRYRDSPECKLRKLLD